MQNQLFEQLLITQQMPAHWSLVTSYTGHSKLHGQWRATTTPWTLESSHLRVSGKARYIRKNGEAKREEGVASEHVEPPEALQIHHVRVVDEEIHLHLQTDTCQKFRIKMVNEQETIDKPWSHQQCSASGFFMGRDSVPLGRIV